MLFTRTGVHGKQTHSARNSRLRNTSYVCRCLRVCHSGKYVTGAVMCNVITDYVLTLA